MVRTPSVFLHFWLGNVLRATAACTFFRHLNVKKWSEPAVFYTFDLERCFAPQPRALFFNIWTSKSGPNPVVFHTFDLERCFAPQRRALFQHLNVKKWSEPRSFLHFWLGKVLRATPACTFFQHLNVKKWSEPRSFFYTFDLETCFAPQRRALFQHLNVKKWSEPRSFLTLLTWKGASRHNGVHFFFNIWRSKSGPNPAVFHTFDLERCFAPQRRALFECQKVVRTPPFFTLLTWKCASRHNGVHFFDIATSKSGLTEGLWHFWLANVFRATTACTFSSLTWPDGSAPAALARLLFGPPEPQIIGKTQWIATFLPFRAPASALFWVAPSLIFSISYLLLPDSSHLCFSISPYFRKFDLSNIVCLCFTCPQSAPLLPLHRQPLWTNYQSMSIIRWEMNPRPQNPCFTPFFAWPAQRHRVRSFF